MVCGAAQKSIALTVCFKRRFTKEAGVNSVQFKPAFTYTQIVTGISKLLFSLQFLSRKVDDLRKTANKYYIFRNTLKAPVKKEARDFQAGFPWLSWHSGLCS